MVVAARKDWLDEALADAAHCHDSREAAEATLARFRKDEANFLDWLATDGDKEKVTPIFLMFPNPLAALQDAFVPAITAHETCPVVYYKDPQGKTHTLTPEVTNYHLGPKLVREKVEASKPKIVEHDGALAVEHETVTKTLRRLVNRLAVSFYKVDELDAEHAALRDQLGRGGQEVGPTEWWGAIARIGGEEHQLIFQGSVEAIRRAIPDEYTRETWRQAGARDLEDLGKPIRIVRYGAAPSL